MESWKKIWGYIPIDFGARIGAAEDITQKIRIKNNVGGSAVKIKFSNLYDQYALLLEQVNVGRVDKKSGQITESVKVTYQGNTQIKVPAGQAFYSDSIPFSIEANEDLAVSVYLKGRHEIYSLCQTWSAKGWQSSFFQGNRAEDTELSGRSTLEMFPFFAYDEHVCNGAFGISGVQILTKEDLAVAACFGDSITHMSYYFDPLQDILYQKYPGKIALVNCGIGGNRVLYDASYVKDMPGCGRCFGKAGRTRFEEDVYGDMVPELVFLMEGINDCTHWMDFGLEGQRPTGAMIFEGLKSMIKLAHEKNSKVCISTVMPFANDSEKAMGRPESIRQELNALIRAHKDLAEGFVDLDEVVRRPENTHFMKGGLHLGDGLHPNEAGGKVIADAIGAKISLAASLEPFKSYL
ncbi:GDSL-type esterase/lipase family protein [Parablautia muri]|uniref:SGNH hydrolase-type esterase domain-containing protein n=1 Tax=Parablautia muri TaxID=2320879 RepID=A0A9X5BE25_9FIRM|nr:GDSL-type esterase/lipase family protein [Parablautia muri]NBJ92344.1 hypothetical protein [Parablautia muri]